MSADPIIDDGRDRSCPHCSWDMEWAECHLIDCEDGAYDIGEEDPINYGPGTYVTCSECHGKGGWWYCPNEQCKPTHNPVGDSK